MMKYTIRIVPITLVLVIISLLAYNDIKTDDNYCLNIAKNFHLNEQYDSAIFYYNKISNKYIDSDPKKYLTCQRGIGNAYNRLGKFDVSNEIYFSALSIAEKNKMDKFIVVLKYDIALNYMSMGQSNKAIAFAQEAYLKSKNCLVNQNNDTLAEIYSCMGNSYRKIGYADSAIYFLERSNTIRSNIVGITPRKLGMNVFNLGIVYESIGDYERALDLFQESLNYYNKDTATKETSFAKVYAMIADVYNYQARYQDALDYHYKALHIFEKYLGPSHFYCLSVCGNIGLAYENLDDYQMANDYLKKTIRGLKENYPTNILEIRTFYYDLSNLCYRTKQYDAAIAYVDTAIAMLSQSKDNNILHLSIYLEGKANNYLQKGNYSQSLKLYEESLKMLVDNHYGKKDISALYADIGSFYYDMKQYDKANAYTDSSLNVLYPGIKFEQVVLNKDFPIISETEFINSLQLKGKILAKEKQVLLALKISNNMIGVLEKLLFNGRDYSLYKKTIDYVNELVSIIGNDNLEKEYKYELFELTEKTKSIYLRSYLREISAKEYANIPDSFLFQESTLKSEISYYQEKIQDGDVDSAKAIEMQNIVFNKKNQYESLKNNLEKNYPSYYKIKYDFSIPQVSAIQKEMAAENSALVEYFINDSSLCVYTITKDNFNLNYQKTDSSFIELINTYKKCLSDYNYMSANPQKSYEEYINSSTKLYQYLFPDSSRQLIEKYSKLFIIPDGMLHYISFDALLTDQSNTSNRNYKQLSYLINKHEISYLSSSEFLFPTNNKLEKSKDNYLGMAPVYDNNWLAESKEVSIYSSFRSAPGNLINNSIEVKDVASLFNGNMLLNENASEGEFKKQAGNNKIIHLAMHALIDDKDPMRSKLLFSHTNDSTEDGFLNAYELYNMNINADLAVLSACNTGDGKLVKGEGVMSLSRAFMYAGCPSIVMSLWKAEDKSTASIIVDFFKHIKNGEEKDVALRNAKLNFIQIADPITSNPFFWANFVVVGDNSSIDTSPNVWFWISLILILSTGIIMGIIFFKKKGNLKSL